MDMKAHLQELFDQHHQGLAAYGWASEDDRWAELVYCLLLQCSDQEAESVRGLVATLRSLSLLEPETMTRLLDPTDERRIVFAYALQRYGFPDGDAERACRVLAGLAGFVESRHAGKFQRYLRRHGEIMRDELVSILDGGGLEKSKLAYALSHWLQNALSMPVSLQHEAVAAFCRDHNASFEELLAAADALNFNMAVVDDLLELAHGAKEPAAHEQETAGSR
jgi:hypothetical protein